jgi:hypothetical protein
MNWYIFFISLLPLKSRKMKAEGGNQGHPDLMALPHG